MPDGSHTACISLVSIAYSEGYSCGCAIVVFRATPIGVFGEHHTARIEEHRLNLRQGCIEFAQLAHRGQIPAMLEINDRGSILVLRALMVADAARVGVARHILQGNGKVEGLIN